MFNKKLILPIFAIAMASFVACGDDDSSFNPTGDTSTPAKEKTPDGQLPDTLQYFSDTEKIPCSQTENKCATVYVKGHSNPIQCDGMGGWYEQIIGPVSGCDGNSSSDPDIVGPGDIMPVKPTDPSTEPSIEPIVVPTSGKVACSSGPACTEGPAELADECKESEGETLLDACPAGGDFCDMGNGITMHLYEGAGITCEDLLAFMQM